MNEWKPVLAPGNTPIMYYRHIPTVYSIFDKRSIVIGREPGILPLPYTAPMLTRRLEYGRDVPANWKAQVFEIAEAA